MSNLLSYIECFSLTRAWIGPVRLFASSAFDIWESDDRDVWVIRLDSGYFNKELAGGSVSPETLSIWMQAKDANSLQVTANLEFPRATYKIKKLKLGYNSGMRVAAEFIAPVSLATFKVYGEDLTGTPGYPPLDPGDITVPPMWQVPLI